MPLFNHTINTSSEKWADENPDVKDLLCRLAKNIILLKNEQPQLFTTDKRADQRGHGFGQQRAAKTLPTTWLGKNFVLQRKAAVSGDGESGADRAPVRPHWRRGHWHTVCCGPKRAERRKAWFQPVYVTGSSQESSITTEQR